MNSQQIKECRNALDNHLESIRLYHLNDRGVDDLAALFGEVSEERRHQRDSAPHELALYQPQIFNEQKLLDLLRQVPSIHTLKLYGCVSSTALFQGLASSAAANHLKVLLICNATLDLDYSKVVIPPDSLLRLKELRLVKTGLNSNLVDNLIQGLERNSNAHLTCLNLGGNCIGNRGCRTLARALVQPRSCLSRLQELVLNNNRIGNDGAAILLKALVKSQNTSLYELNLNSNHITDTTKLAKTLPHLKGLKVLDLFGWNRTTTSSNTTFAVSFLAPLAQGIRTNATLISLSYPYPPQDDPQAQRHHAQIQYYLSHVHRRYQQERDTLELAEWPHFLGTVDRLVQHNASVLYTLVRTEPILFY